MTMQGPRRVGVAGRLGVWCACAIALLVWLLLYREMLDGWWMADDTQHLLSVFRHGIAAHFSVPHQRLGLIPANLTPWLFLSYGVDHAVGGLDPSFAYWHHLVAWLLTVAVLTGLLCARFGVVAALIAVPLWLVSVPAGVVVQFLCTRHYLEGLLAALLAIIVYDSDLRRPSGIKVAGLTVLCALGMAAKEVYVPLVVCLLVHRWGREIAAMDSRGRDLTWSSATWLGIRATLGHLWPLPVLGLLYGFWRAHMLGAGRLLAGYGAGGPTSTAEALRALPELWAVTIHGGSGAGGLALALITAGVLKWLLAHRRAPVLRYAANAITWAVCISFPALMVASGVQDNPHYLFLPSLAWLVALAWAVRYVWGEGEGEASAAQWMVRLGLCVCLALLVQGHWQARGRLWLWADRVAVQQYRVEGERALYGQGAAMIVEAAGPPWHHLGLQSLQREVLHKTSITLLCAGPACAEVPQAALQGLQCTAFDRGTRALRPAVCPASTASP